MPIAMVLLFRSEFDKPTYTQCILEALDLPLISDTIIKIPFGITYWETVLREPCGITSGTAVSQIYDVYNDTRCKHTTSF